MGALDLIRVCLDFHPGKRISAKDGLRHPYVIQFHNPEDEPSCDRAIRIPIDDNTKLTVQDYRERLYDEVLRKKKEQRRIHRRNLEMEQEVMRQHQSQPAQAQPPQRQLCRSTGARTYTSTTSCARGACWVWGSLCNLRFVAGSPLQQLSIRYLFAATEVCRDICGRYPH